MAPNSPAVRKRFGFEPIQSCSHISLLKDAKQIEQFLHCLSENWAAMEKYNNAYIFQAR